MGEIAQQGSIASPRPRVVERWSEGAQVCRCGTKLAARVPFLVVVDDHSVLSGMLDGHAFCSTLCVRAWFLESLDAFQQIDTPENERTVLDLRAAFAELASAFATILDAWNRTRAGPS